MDSLPPSSFPSWAGGHWEDIFIEGATIVFKDRIDFRTYSGKVLPAVGSAAFICSFSASSSRQRIRRDS
jgi:hypothetical protein